MSYTGSCYQGPEAGQMLTHDTTKKDYYIASESNGDPVLIGAYVFDGYDLWKWEPYDYVSTRPVETL